MNKLIILFVVLALGIGAFLFFNFGNETTQNTIVSDSPLPSLDVLSEVDDIDITEEVVTNGDSEASVTSKTIFLTGENYKFRIDGVVNPDIVVQEGDFIRIEFESVQGFHDFVIDELNVVVQRVTESDGRVFVEFIADKKGTFEYFCSVGSHRAQGMFGNFIVE